MNRALACYSTPSTLMMRRQLNTRPMKWIDEMMDDLFARPRMEIWPASRLRSHGNSFIDGHRSFIDRQLSKMQNDMEKMFKLTNHSLQSVEQADGVVGQQQLKVIEDDEKEFRLNLGCSQFKPEEINCKLDDKYLTIEGKQEHKDEDTGSFSSRQFLRRILLPENAELDKVNCAFKSDGVLAITIPKKQPAIEEPKEEDEKVIPIQREQTSKT